MLRYLRLLPVLMIALPSLGCGKDYHLGPVSGRVTMDGRPLAKAEVRFFPASREDLPHSSGITNEEGQYELHLVTDASSQGAIIGEHRVTISMDQRRGKVMPMNKANMPKRLGELLPAKYNRESKMTFTVPADGTNEANFELKSK